MDISNIIIITHNTITITYNTIHMTIKGICLILVLTASTALPQECFNQYIQSQSCFWYSLCLEEKFQCGKDGYPIGYGYKYCTKFGSLKSYPQVRQWIEKTTICLKQRLSQALSPLYTKTCHQLRNDAFNTHPICYKQAGFCKLWRQLGAQKSAVFFKQLLGIFQAKDFDSLAAIKQIQQTIKQCA